MTNLKIQQISIFLENIEGRINDVTTTLAKNQINMLAFSMAETAEFAILRLIVDDVEGARKALADAGFAVTLSEVLCIQCANHAGTLAKIIAYLSENKVYIKYMYAFSQGELANVVIKPSDRSRCIELLQNMDCSFLNLQK